MALSWNEIKDRAARFAQEWENTTREEADAKPFLIDFFNVFGISRKKVATFEEKVKKLDGGNGYIDLFWKGTLLVEMKSRGKNLDDAFQQAKDYLQKVKAHELPRYILVSDFHTLRLHDLEAESVVEFTLDALVQNVQHFGFIAGYQKRAYKEQDPVNLKAAALMGQLHDRLKAIGYTGHALEVYLVRMLFCLFAEDTTIFQRQQFQDYIEERTAEDGSDLAARISELFQVLNTPEERRFKNLDEQLAAFPYVNGRLFEEILPIAHFDTAMRAALLQCCYLDWSLISPAIFGSMFQSVMNPQERRNLGAHYTSEKNILKLIRPLFLEDLWMEFEKAKRNAQKLVAFHQKLASLRFLDPACGCGNFLVITYRELRLLEIAVLRAMNQNGQGFLDVRDIIWIDVDAMYGIEYEEFPAQIAQVALWLIDHQMNMIISQEFGQYFARLPLKKAATIVHGNALRIDWQEMLQKSAEKLPPQAENFSKNIAERFALLEREAGLPKQPTLHYDYILGNPPFIGHHYQTREQKADMAFVFAGMQGYGVLDYVSAWYVVAAKYLSALPRESTIVCAFVSTNSISQGEQVGLLWTELFNRYHVKITFAHRTFSWKNEAQGNAAVHVVIIGFSNEQNAPDNKLLFEYEDSKGEAHGVLVKNINPYLIDAPDVVVVTRSSPISNVPKMIWGNKPTDGGYFLFEDEKEKNEFLVKEPAADKWIRPFVSGSDFIQGHFRYCLWLKEISPAELNRLAEVKKRVQAVKEMRLESKAEATNKKAATPTLFAQIAQPESDYLAIPEVSSERRRYIPVAFLSKEIVASNTVQLVPNATLYHFGIITSTMHMAWVRAVCGRLKSDFRYSNTIVYNNFPWPKAPSTRAVASIEAAAQGVLDARAQFPHSSLADLYDPVAMPPLLAKAHEALDRAVDKAYGSAFATEAKRMEHLFALYEEYVAGLFAGEKAGKKKRG